MLLMAGKYVNLLALLAVATLTQSWELPNLPSGRRSQYYVLHDDGGYKYGYDTGIDHFGKQAGDSNNEVSGHYVYKTADGQDVDIKYTAGVNGFIPEGLDKLAHQTNGPYAAAHAYHLTPKSSFGYSTDDQAKTGDASYAFTIDTDSYKRQESSDPSGNIQGRYSYTNDAGQHDLTYIAGENTGFVATSGSLSHPNGLVGKNLPAHPTTYASGHTTGYDYAAPSTIPSASVLNDGSYKFEFTTGDQSRQESSDPSGNVQGRYSYTNEAGTHDLSYIAGENTGFVATSGSLSQPNGLVGQNILTHPTTYTSSHTTDYTAPSTIPSASVFSDGSYNFEYSTGDQSRQESSDPAGNVQGRYSYTNEAGTHDLSYVAGSQTGFQPTGGNLATPIGVSRTGYNPVHIPTVYSGYTPVITSYQSDAPNTDGSYSFEYSTGDQSRQESADTAGNVQGKYSFTNEAGSHDLSYVAGAQTGFQPTGGSLSVPNGLTGQTVPSTYSYKSSSGSYKPPVTTYSSADTEDDQSNTGDASYSFSIDTDEYKRKESSDAQGNVKGSYSFKNNAGVHDLSFVAGSETGFLPTGGSLSVPNGVDDKATPKTYSSYGPSQTTGYQYNPPPVTSYSNKDDDESNTGDASYSFAIDTDDYKRQESSDAQGNVKGTYSYKNNAGVHDLSFVSGSETGFLPTGGSLATPNGLEGKNVPSSGAVLSRSYIPPSSSSSQSDEQSSDDGSYSFSIDTDDYNRKESADSQGNVKGTYSYKNYAGTHDLSYSAGANTGFVPISGSLAAPNGLSGPYAAPDYIPPQVKMSDYAKTKAEFTHGKVGNVFLKHYYPSRSQSKYGYIFESA